MQNKNDREVEVKFYLTDSLAFERKLQEAGAVLVQPRINEWNLRFDTPNNGLSSNGQVLRLRKDQRCRLTYKSDSILNGDVTDRQELEVEISSFDTMRKMLEALGYTVFVMYEKFRTTWHWMDCEITLDEMPYGYFCEIEGQDSTKIMRAADVLGLQWDARILTSYLGIFTALKNAGKTQVDNLIFSVFTGYENAQANFEAINIHPADVS